MPRLKSPASLYVLSLGCVSRNIRSLCPDGEDPFADLPTAINEDLVNILQSVKPVTVNFDCLCRILGAGVREIDLSLIDCCKGVRSRLPRLLRAIRYDNLTRLSLSGAAHREDGELLGAIPSWHGLHGLTLLLPNVTDRVVAAVASHCLDLTELVLHGERVTDRSLHLLVRCDKLRLLRLEGDRRFSPAVTAPSIFKLLNELKELRRASLPCLTEAIQRFERDRKLPLVEYDDEDCIASLARRSLLHVCQVCPHLTRVKLTPRGSEDLSPLQWLRSLRSLSLNVMETRAEAYFRVRVQPLVGVLGANMRSLMLHLTDVDLGVLAKHCGNLEELEIVNLHSISWSGSHRPKFPKLKKLKLFMEADGAPSSANLFDVLSAGGELEEVSLGWCRLQDDTLRRLAEAGSASKLRTLELSQVEEVTVAGLMHLVVVPNDLALLSIVGCDRIHRADVDRLRACIVERNYDLTVRHYV